MDYVRELWMKSSINLLYNSPYNYVRVAYEKNKSRETRERWRNNRMATFVVDNISREHNPKTAKNIYYMMKEKHCWNDLIMKKFNQKVTFSVVDDDE